jgi:DNA-binding MarR family transcriptional regulator
MTSRSGARGGEGGPSLPLPALLTQAKDIAIEKLHQRLADEGYEGIRYVHGAVFRFVDADGSRLTTLAERSGLTKQAVGELVNELEERGYVERVTDPDDRRAKIIRLTARGKMAQTAAGRILMDVEQRWSRRLGRDRIDALRQTLEEVLGLESGE